MTDTTTKKPRLYCAGPMRGLVLYGFPLFDAARDRLNALGWDVVSPADIDRACGFDPNNLSPEFDWDTLPESLCIEEILLRDVEALATCDAIFLMHGWEASSGSNRELAEARKMGLREFYEDVCASPSPDVMREVRLSPLEIDPQKYHDIMLDALKDTIRTAQMDGAEIPFNVGEVRVTDPTTGGQKGAKAERYDLLPVEPMAELARHYGIGANKYADHNYRKGYKWSLSYAALQRHLNAFWRGEDMDAETGSKHVIAAAFHCLALAEYMDTKRSHDDRYVRGKAEVAT